MHFLKQSTAVTIKIGPFVDDTDANTVEDGLTLSQADIRLSKNGANIAQKTESSAATHDELGYYDCDLDTTDTGTLGRLQLFVHESGALPVWHDFMIMPANVWDSLFGADRLQVHAAEITDALITAAAVAEDAIGLSEIASAVIDAINAQSPGSGAITFTYTLTSSEDSSAITGADVWATSDQAGNTVVASGVTDASGQVAFYLDAGTYYFWAQKAGFNFTNPDTEVVA